MDEEVNESLLPENQYARRNPLGRSSTLQLWLKRKTIGVSRRLIIFLLVSASFIYYWTSSFASIPVGTWRPKQRYTGPPTSDAEWKRRARAVKLAFLDAYYSYERVAFPYDEIRPLTSQAVILLNGWGLTAIDSLDTLILMGMSPQVNRTIEHIKSLDFKEKHRSKRTLFFETTIRYLAGMLSAYDLTKNQDLLDKADELGVVLLSAFDTPSGLPIFAVDSATGAKIPVDWNGGYSLLSEIGSCQLEFKYLAHLTGKKVYFEAVDKITTILQKQQNDNGLWNTFWNTTTGEQANAHYSVGAWADSAYEYLLKEYLLTGKTDQRLEDMYKRAAFGAIAHLMYISPHRHLVYITDISKGHVTGYFEHLSCFFPATLTLGVWSLPNLIPHERELHEMAANALAESCWVLYKDTTSGIGPDIALFKPWDMRDIESGRFMKHYEKWDTDGRKRPGPIGLDRIPEPVDPIHLGAKYRDYYSYSAEYKLRPETVETMYIMWKTTGNVIWRERAWEIFQRFEQWTRVPNGYAPLVNVDRPAEAGHKDGLPSYWFAETFKYLYLSFIDPKEDPWPLDRFVFNTEAHPLPIWTPTDAEIQARDAFRRKTSGAR